MACQYCKTGNKLKYKASNCDPVCSIDGQCSGSGGKSRFVRT